MPTPTLYEEPHNISRPKAPHSQVVKVRQPGKHPLRKHGQLIVVEVPAGNSQGAPPSAYGLGCPSNPSPQNNTTPRARKHPTHSVETLERLANTPSESIVRCLPDRYLQARGGGRLRQVPVPPSRPTPVARVTHRLPVQELGTQVRPAASWRYRTPSAVLKNSQPPQVVFWQRLKASRADNWCQGAPRT